MYPALYRTRIVRLRPVLFRSMMLAAWLRTLMSKSVTASTRTKLKSAPGIPNKSRLVVPGKDGNSGESLGVAAVGGGGPLMGGIGGVMSSSSLCKDAVDGVVRVMALGVLSSVLLLLLPLSMTVNLLANVETFCPVPPLPEYAVATIKCDPKVNKFCTTGTLAPVLVPFWPCSGSPSPKKYGGNSAVVKLGMSSKSKTTEPISYPSFPRRTRIARSRPVADRSMTSFSARLLIPNRVSALTRAKPLIFPDRLATPSTPALSG
jgi:hypothetical protein